MISLIGVHCITDNKIITKYIQQIDKNNSCTVNYNCATHSFTRPGSA